MELPRSDRPHREDLREERRQEQRQKNQAAIALLDALMNVDDHEAEEQRQTLEYLQRVLNEDRLSDRDRFAST